MTVHLDEFLAAGLRYHELGRLQFLLDAKDHTFVSLNTDCCGTELRESGSEGELEFMVK